MLGCLLTVSCFTLVTSAEDVFSASVNEAGTVMTISGTSELTEGTTVSITVLMPGKTLASLASGSLDGLAFLFEEVKLASGGVFNYTYNLPENMKSGRYNVYVKVYGEDKYRESFIDYKNVAAANKAAEELNKGASVSTVVNSYSTDIDVDAGTKYEAYSEAEKGYVIAYIEENKGEGDIYSEKLTQLFRDGVERVESLKAVKKLDRPDVKTYLEENSGALGISSATFGRYNALTDMQKQLAVVNFANGLTSVTDPDVLDKLLSDSIIAALEYKNESGSGSGGGGGGSFGSGNRVTSGGGAYAPSEPSGDKKYTDIENVKWAETAINALTDAGIVNGKAEGKFYPADTLTREEAVKIIVLGFGLEEKGNMAFDDIVNGAWYSDYINIAVKCGVIKGVSNSQFGIGQPVSRQDMMVMLARAAAYINKEIQSVKQVSFKDNDSIADYAKDAVQAMANAEVINGRENGCFDPASSATRAEAAQMCYRLLNKLQLL